MKAVTIARWLLLLGLAFLCRWVKGTVCPSSELPTKLDPASKAYLSPIVFQGVLLDVDKSGNTGLKVTYKIEKIHKMTEDSKIQSNTNAVVIYSRRRNRNKSAAESKETTVTRFNRAQCQQFHLKEKDLRKNQLYIVYGEELSTNFVGVFEPVAQTKKAVRAVRKVLSPGNAKPAKLRGLKNIVIKSKNRLRLKCKIEGFPHPWVAWYRDGKKLKGDARIKIRVKRKDSRLLIQQTTESDSGRYECRARNVVNRQTAALSANVLVHSEERTPTSTAATTLPFQGEKCQGKAVSFCLNGGTCKFFPSLGEWSCHCAEGYKGARCQNKDISPVGVLSSSCTEGDCRFGRNDQNVANILGNPTVGAD